MLRRDDTLVIVVDFQDSLLAKIDGAERIVPAAVKLLQCMAALDVPVMATEQYPKGLGRTTEAIASVLGDRAIFEKTAFGCFGEPGFADLVSRAEVSQLLVVGIEAHVCVLQTALQACLQGYEVFVARDAVGSRHAVDYEAGLARLASNGVQLVTVEMAIFEMLGAAGTPLFKKVLPFIK